MSKPFTNPFFEADMSKFFDMSKMQGDFRLPQFNVESLFAAQRRNIESFTALQQAASESWQSLWQRQAELCRQAVEDATQIVNAIVASPSPEDKIIKQAEAGKAAVDKCLANMRDIAETVAKCNTQAMEAVSNRMSEGLDELRGIIKHSNAA